MKGKLQFNLSGALNCIIKCLRDWNLKLKPIHMGEISGNYLSYDRNSLKVDRNCTWTVAYIYMIVKLI